MKQTESDHASVGPFGRVLPDTSSWKSLAVDLGVLKDDDYRWIMKLYRAPDGDARIETYCESRVWQEIWRRATDHPTFPSFSDLKVEFVTRNKLTRVLEELRSERDAFQWKLLSAFVGYVVVDQLILWVL